MKYGLVIADSGPIFSLALTGQLHLLDFLFNKINIPQAVWEEISSHETMPFHNEITEFFKDKVQFIHSFNDLTFVMDYGESESIILYKELSADFLLIDDKKARNIAESLGVNCVGTIGILSISRENGAIKKLRPIFKKLIENKRFYSIELLNSILTINEEESI